jgi:hypothetical protein
VGRASITKKINTTAPLLAFVLQGLGMLLIAVAHAGEIDAFSGHLESDTNGSGTYTWGIEYRQPLSDHFSGSFLWLNEGHLPHNHRDGQAVQLWWRSKPDPIGFVFEAGLGPYRYYDTHLLDADPGFEDKHGWAALASASADWYFTNKWFVFLRLNQIAATDKYDSSSASLGIGYRFADLLSRAGDASDGEATQAEPRWEIDGLFGERVANTDHSETGLAQTIDVRRELSEHFTVSATFIAAQGTKLDWREGFAAQFWLEQRLTQRFTVSAGAGAFVVSKDDSVANAESPSNLAAMISVSVAYDITPRWVGRAVWHRIGTGDDHDADIVLLGVGYRF